MRLYHPPAGRAWRLPCWHAALDLGPGRTDSGRQRLNEDPRDARRCCCLLWQRFIAGRANSACYRQVQDGGGKRVEWINLPSIYP